MINNIKYPVHGAYIRWSNNIILGKTHAHINHPNYPSLTESRTTKNVIQQYTCKPCYIETLNQHHTTPRLCIILPRKSV